uniref:Ima1 N-terminal domain-containing protein n=1 Tax=Plectus sambesii TaxID=2011161 RepID=A0A914WC04_9BILA
MSWPVNCWFCNANSRVQYERRNAWTCPECEQYNGFTETGDYNRDMREQRDGRLNRHFTQLTRPKRQQPPDLTSLDPPNGLCNSCNENQALKVRQLAIFTPIDEKRYDEEVESFKSRLEKIYPLCAKCDQFLHNTLAYQQQKLGLLDGLRRRFQYRKPLDSPTKSFRHKPPSTPANRSIRSRRAHPGALARSLHIFCVTVASLLFIVDLNNLQNDSQTELICFARYLPVALLNALSWLPKYAAALSVISAAAQALSMKVAKARLVLPDLLIMPAWIGLIALHTEAITTKWTVSKQDLFLCQTALACLTALLAMSVAVLPRKRLCKKRPNFVSAFSIASTPLSQCSSARESLSSSFNRSAASVASSVSRNKTPSAFRLSPSLLADGGNSMSARSTANERRQMADDREVTPSRELGGKLDKLSIGLSSSAIPQLSAQRRRGPFSSLSINASTFRPEGSIWSSPPSTRSTVSAFGSRPLLAPSRLNALSSEYGGSLRFSPPKSQITSAQSGYWTSNDDADSVMTSASRMHLIDCSPTANKSQLWWNCLIGLGVLVSLTVNALVLYFHFSKNSKT